MPEREEGDMALTKGVTRKVEVPHEQGAWLELRQLNFRQIAEARALKLNTTIDLLRSLEGIPLPAGRAWSIDNSAPPGSFDVPTLLKYGIVAWSYGDEVTPDELDERTAIWAACEIVALSVPDEATEKKG